MGALTPRDRRRAVPGDPWIVVPNWERFQQLDAGEGKLQRFSLDSMIFDKIAETDETIGGGDPHLSKPRD